MKRFLSALLLGLAVLATGCSQIDTGNVGVIKTSGQYKAEELDPGWHWTPISTVYEVSTKENPVIFDNIKPKTQDQITVEDLDIDLYVKLIGGKASETMTRFAGDLAKNSDGDYIPGYGYLQREARNVIYDVVGGIQSADAQKERTAIPAKVEKELQARLDKQFGVGWWVVTNANMRNLTIDSALEKKIREAAQVQYEIEAKKKQIVLAQAEAERVRAIAQGEADAMRIKAEGLKASQGQEYLKLLEIQNEAEAIKKWNGALPTTNAGGATPLLNLSK